MIYLKDGLGTQSTALKQMNPFRGREGVGRRGGAEGEGAGRGWGRDEKVVD